MLVLSRKDGERVRIGTNIFVTLVQSKDGKARLGIDAPKEVEVVRTEIDTNPPESQGLCRCPLSQKAPEKEAG